MVTIKTPEREIADLARELADLRAKLRKVTQERDALRSLDAYTDEQLEERRREIADLQMRRWEERRNRMCNAFKVLGASRFESFEDLIASLTRHARSEEIIKALEEAGKL